MAPEVEPRVVAGRFAITGVAGRGAMGTVWVAQDLVLGRTVALKEIAFDGDAADNEVRRARATREATVAARVAHANLVTIYDVVDADDRIFLVLEHLAVTTLKERVAQAGRLPPATVAAIGRALVSALAALHDAGVVHRDVKPGNVFVYDGGRAKLGDFGVVGVEDGDLTSPGFVIGSPGFVAPEVAVGGKATPASDVWSLGATLWFAIEGRPFVEGGGVAALGQVVHHPAPPAPHAGPLAPVLAGALERDPAARPSLDELASALLVAANEPAPVVVEPTPSPRRRRLAPALVAGAVAIVAVALAAFVLGGGDDDPGAGDTTTTEAAAPPLVGATVHVDEAAGYAVAVPAGWEVQPLDGTRTDFGDPSSATYLRIDWTDAPGPSPAAAWEALSADFAGRREGYEEIRIEPMTFQGYDAALWEFTYVEDGVQLHAYDLGFVTEDRGFALNLQAREADWASVQELWDQLQAGFEVR